MILTICRKGQVRSRAMANELRARGYTAQCAGIETTENIHDLIGSATTIITMADWIYNELPKEVLYRTKSVGWEDDIWGSPDNPELIGLCKDWLDEEGFE